MHLNGSAAVAVTPLPLSQPWGYDDSSMHHHRPPLEGWIAGTRCRRCAMTLPRVCSRRRPTQQQRCRRPARLGSRGQAALVRWRSGVRVSVIILVRAFLVHLMNVNKVGRMSGANLACPMNISGTNSSYKERNAKRGTPRYLYVDSTQWNQCKFSASMGVVVLII